MGKLLLDRSRDDVTESDMDVLLPPRPLRDVFEGPVEDFVEPLSTSCLDSDKRMVCFIKF